MLENSLSTNSEVNLELNLLSILLIIVKTNRDDTIDINTVSYTHLTLPTKA